MNISWIEAENLAKVDPNEWIRRVNLYTKNNKKNTKYYKIAIIASSILYFIMFR